MSTVQARRTLVKSPPELWAELSDAEILGRRLQPFGEIRITRLEPETSLAWEGERVRGTVEIEASGWGTRVTLTAERSEEPAASSEPSSEPSTEPEEPPTWAPDPTEPMVVPTPEELPQTTAALGQGYDTSRPIEPRPSPLPIDPGGFMIRLFGIRWRSRGWAPSAEAPAPEAPPLEPAPVPLPDPLPLPDSPELPTPEVTPEPEPEPPLEPAADRPQEPDGPAPAAMDEVLSQVLDDLGAAHHRPFSRG